MERLGLEPTPRTTETLEGTGVYDPTRAHQDTQKPIPLDREEIWAPDAFSDDWRGLFDCFFRDIEEGFRDVVRWSE